MLSQQLKNVQILCHADHGGIELRRLTHKLVQICAEAYEVAQICPYILFLSDMYHTAFMNISVYISLMRCHYDWIVIVITVRCDYDWIKSDSHRNKTSKCIRWNLVLQFLVGAPVSWEDAYTGSGEEPLRVDVHHWHNYCVWRGERRRTRRHFWPQSCCRSRE